MHEQFLCDPRILSITLTQDPKILDGCLNGGLIIGYLECMMNNEQRTENAQPNPRVYFINSIRNPRVSLV
jgi:hypothetical protein